ncbi:hypothetical protein LOTGIDRAFT_160546 [Lottia gigantea]|uniref:Major facilitator superfamily (MFS) profile domain-containing protein n=1 Tax=Lottia gigantea TaxID=225164 RepID=V4AEW9_LOTGI|nr:hypothetical protein LOTGIDRAFT_160546 [Lottia gigantea]ESO95407.1 hypothetical protein LOTGIDRAFT_160546 [Lottia gigantea]
MVKDDTEKLDRWAWVVLAASFFSILVNGSLYFCVGVIHTALLDAYPDKDETLITWIGSVFSSVSVFGAIFGSVIINLFNVRTCVILGAVLNLTGFVLSSLVTEAWMLIITYGIIAGIGQSITLMSSMVILGYYFKEKTSMATGIATSASGLALFIFPVLTQYLLEEYGIRGTFLMFGAIGFQAAVGGSLMRPTKFDQTSMGFSCCRKGNHEVERKAIRNESQPLLKSVGLWCLLINSWFLGASLSIIFLFLPEFNIYMGSTHGEAAFIMSVVGITGILSRIFLGFIGTILDPALVLFGLFGTIGTMTFFIGEMKSLAVKIMYAAVLGFYTGGTWSLQHTLVVEIAGLHRLSTVYGVTMVCAGFGYMSGPPFTGMFLH